MSVLSVQLARMEDPDLQTFDSGVEEVNRTFPKDGGLTARRGCLPSRPIVLLWQRETVWASPQVPCVRSNSQKAPAFAGSSWWSTR